MAIKFKSPRRILQVVPALNSGGVEKGTIEISQAIQKASGKAYVTSSGGKLVKELQKIHAKHLTLPLHLKNPFSLLLNIFRLKKLIDTHKIELVHARSRAPAWSAYAAAKWAGVPFVTTYHGTYNSNGSLKNFYNSIMARGDITIANSKFTKSHIAKHHPSLSKNTIAIPRGIDLKVFSPSKVSKKDQQELAKKWGLKDKTPVILLPGRLTRWKGQLLLIEALAQLKNKNYVCILVGDAQGRESYVQEIKEKIASLGLEKIIKIKPPQKNMATVYSIADIVVSASTDPEAFGRVVAEACAMEKIVVAPNHGGALEIIDTGKTGFLYQAKSSKALAKTLQGALDLKSSSALRKKAREKISKEFTKDLMCENTLKVYKKLLNEG